MKVKKNDTILITAGKDRGRTGKVLRVLVKEEAVLVEGINLKKKHAKPKKEGEKGQVVQIPAPLNISNIKVICSKCGKATRVGYKVDKERKVRVCKKCGQEI
ncbi:MAG: 50S ribosomal protein L24 [Patescibacteria group bacterium]